MARGKKSWSHETFWTVVYAVLIAIFIRTVAYEPFNIPSGSMKPTLLVGDYLFVSKFSYGYSKHSLPFSLPLISGRVLFSEPERGDVVVFKKPTDNKTDYIKRIVGLPGDKIQLIDSILHINGKPVKREPAPESVNNNFNGMKRFVETLPNGRRHYIFEFTQDIPHEVEIPKINPNLPPRIRISFTDNTPVYTVPAGHYFGMGDNRDNSQDSRYLDKVGYIPRENLVGRAEFLFFSIDSINGDVWKFWKWPQTLRFGRIFNGIE